MQRLLLLLLEVLQGPLGALHLDALLQELRVQRFSRADPRDDDGAQDAAQVRRGGLQGAKGADQNLHSARNCA